MIVIRSYPTGVRLWVLGQRTHHGLVGCLLIAAGLVLALHDRQDAQFWFKRERP